MYKNKILLALQEYNTNNINVLLIGNKMIYTFQ